MPASSTVAELGSITRIGGLFAIKTSSLLARLAALAAECRDDLVITLPHSFDALAVTTRVARDRARTLCGEWLDALPGDQLELEIGPATVVAASAEAALPAGAPELVGALGADMLEAVAYDGAAWTYVVAQPVGAGPDATIARVEHVAAALGVTTAQRKIAAGLHRALARDQVSRAWLRARGGTLDPVVGLAWDRVEWEPIQSMLAGFYPAAGAVEKIARLARATETEHASVELLLGPSDPPALRIAVRLHGAA